MRDDMVAGETVIVPVGEYRYDTVRGYASRLSILGRKYRCHFDRKNMNFEITRLW